MSGNIHRILSALPNTTFAFLGLFYLTFPDYIQKNISFISSFISDNPLTYLYFFTLLLALYLLVWWKTSPQADARKSTKKYLTERYEEMDRFLKAFEMAETDEEFDNYLENFNKHQSNITDWLKENMNSSASIKFLSTNHFDQYDSSRSWPKNQNSAKKGLRCKAICKTQARMLNLEEIIQKNTWDKL